MSQSEPRELTQAKELFKEGKLVDSLQLLEDLKR